MILFCLCPQQRLRQLSPYGSHVRLLAKDLLSDGMWRRIYDFQILHSSALCFHGLDSFFSLFEGGEDDHFDTKGVFDLVVPALGHQLHRNDTACWTLLSSACAEESLR